MNFSGPTPIVTSFIEENLPKEGFTEREKKLIYLATELERRMRTAERVIEDTLESATVYHDLLTPTKLNSYLESADKHDDTYLN